MKDINRWVFEIPLQDIMEESYQEGKGKNPCICCGKDIKSVKFLVHLLDSGNLVSTDESFSNSQGFFPIGSACKDKLPNNFYFKS